jgi:hypothetical protein
MNYSISVPVSSTWDLNTNKSLDFSPWKHSIWVSELLKHVKWHIPNTSREVSCERKEESKQILILTKQLWVCQRNNSSPPLLMLLPHVSVIRRGGEVLRWWTHSCFVNYTHATGSITTVGSHNSWLHIQLTDFDFFSPLIPFYFAICTSTFSKLCEQRIKQHVEGRSVALLCK